MSAIDGTGEPWLDGQTQMQGYDFRREAANGEA